MPRTPINNLPGVAGLGRAGRGRARLGAVWPITASFTGLGLAVLGSAWPGKARRGKARVRMNINRRKT